MKLRTLLLAGVIAFATPFTAAVLTTPAYSQGVPTIDTTSIARLAEMITQAKSQLQEQIAQNLKLDDQTLKMIQQIQLMQSQIDALKNGMSLADLGFDKDSFLDDILPGFSDLSGSLQAAKGGNWGSVLSAGAPFGSGSVTAYVDGALSRPGSIAGVSMSCRRARTAKPLGSATPRTSMPSCQLRRKLRHKVPRKASSGWMGWLRRSVTPRT